MKHGHQCLVHQPRNKKKISRNNMTLQFIPVFGKYSSQKKQYYIKSSYTLQYHLYTFSHPTGLFSGLFFGIVGTISNPLAEHF
jgi:hypothetical protein